MPRLKRTRGILNMWHHKRQAEKQCHKVHPTGTDVDWSHQPKASQAPFSRPPTACSLLRSRSRRYLTRHTFACLTPTEMSRKRLAGIAGGVPFLRRFPTMVTMSFTITRIAMPERPITSPCHEPPLSPNPDTGSSDAISGTV